MKKLLFILAALLLVCSSCQNETQSIDWTLVAYGEADYNYDENSLIIYNELPVQKQNQYSENTDTLCGLPVFEEQREFSDKAPDDATCQNVAEKDTSKYEIYEVPEDVVKNRLQFGFSRADKEVDWKQKVYLYRYGDFYAVTNLSYGRYQTLVSASSFFADDDFYNSIQPFVIGGIAFVLLLIYLYGWIMVIKGNFDGYLVHHILWICLIFGIVINIFDGYSGAALYRDYPPKSVKTEEIHEPYLIHMRLSDDLDSERKYAYTWNETPFSTDTKLTSHDEAVLIEGYNFWAMMLLRKFLRYTFFALIFVFWFLNFIFARKVKDDKPTSEEETK